MLRRNLTQREQGVTIDFIRQQIKIAFLDVTADQAKTAVIAYERSGRSEQERQLPQNRQKKFVRESVHASLKYTMKQQRKQSVSSTADLSMREMQQNCLRSRTLTEDS